MLGTVLKLPCLLDKYLAFKAMDARCFEINVACGNRSFKGWSRLKPEIAKSM